MPEYNYFKFALRLIKEGRWEEFTKRIDQMPQGTNYGKALGELCREFGITEAEVMSEEKPIQRSEPGPTGGEICRRCRLIRLCSGLTH